MARRKTIDKELLCEELWKIVAEYNKKVEGVNATHKINAITQLCKMKGYLEAEKSEITSKQISVKLKF